MKHKILMLLLCVTFMTSRAQKKLEAHYCFKGTPHSLAKAIEIAQITINNDSTCTLVETFYQSKHDLKFKQIWKSEETRGTIHQRGADTLAFQFDSRPDLTFIPARRHTMTLIDNGRRLQTWRVCK